MIPVISYPDAATLDALFSASRLSPENRAISDSVSRILGDIRQFGEEALLSYTEQLDGVRLSRLEVTEEEINSALDQIDSDFLQVLKTSAAQIRSFHSHQKRNGFSFSPGKGILLGQMVTPLDRVGIYVPGGTAAYPSTVLMNAIPAKIAGCREIFMATPPSPNGQISPEILAAARLAGVTRIFKAGGAQAIGAFAYGTASIPAVDKITGPGNAYVAEAKRQVFGLVAIDMIAGPSEILIISDGHSSPRHLAADLLSQAEHDKMARAVLITTSSQLALQVQQSLEEQLLCLPRQEIARTSLKQRGCILVVNDLPAAIQIANQMAPEHLELCVDSPFDHLPDIRHAGSIFLGRHCPEALGDYLAGPNHTLPTGGTARFFSPLSVDDFVKTSQYTYYTREAFLQAAPSVAAFARKEGLEAHGRSALIRKEEAYE